MGQVAVYSSVERRRRWSDEERRQILEDAFSPGACVTQVARRYDVSTALIYTWRRKMCEPVIEPGFAEALIIDGDRAEPSIDPPAIIVELASGKRVSIFASASPALATAALKALR